LWPLRADGTGYQLNVIDLVLQVVNSRRDVFVFLVVLLVFLPVPAGLLGLLGSMTLSGRVGFVRSFVTESLQGEQHEYAAGNQPHHNIGVMHCIKVPLI